MREILATYKIMARVTRNYEPTITAELFEAWTKLRRRGDPDLIAAKLGKSRPVIDKALKYGFVKSQDVVDGITEFYRERKKSEMKDGADLLKEKTV